MLKSFWSLSGCGQAILEDPLGAGQGVCVMQVTLSTQDPVNYTLGPALPCEQLETSPPHFLGRLFQHPPTLESGGKGGSNGWVNTDGDHQEVRGGGGWDHGKVNIDRKSGQSAKD